VFEGGAQALHRRYPVARTRVAATKNEQRG